MRITSSQVAMTATHEVSVSVMRRERLEASRDVEDAERTRRRGDDVRGHRQGRQSDLRDHDHHHDRREVRERSRVDLEAFERLAVELMSIFRRARGEGLTVRGDAGERGQGRGRDREIEVGRGQSPRWNVVYDRHEERRALERTTFAAAGTVTTADGRTIDFATAFAQLRREVSTSDVHVELRGLGAPAKGAEPVLSPLGRESAGETNEEPVLKPLGSQVDANTDASATVTGPEQASAGNETPVVSTPASRSSRLFLAGGYLSLTDPVVVAPVMTAPEMVARESDAGEAAAAEDASPLPRHAEARWLGGVSGDAFRDLALLDSDHNGWIDEADPVWGLLRVVQPTTDTATDTTPGTGATLTDAGIGAIAVQSLATPFGSATSTTPQLAATGVYLKETGEVGKVQQLTFVA
jgi:hypothetical protein